LPSFHRATTGFVTGFARQAFRSTVKIVDQPSTQNRSEVSLPSPAPKLVFNAMVAMGSGLSRCLARIDIPRQPEGIEARNGLPLVFIGNHRSLFDILLGMRIIRRWNTPGRFMVKGEFFERRWTGSMLRVLGAIPVTNGRGAKLAFDQAAQALRSGESVVIMPEARIVPAEERPLGTGDLVSTLGRLVSVGPCMVVISGLIGADDVWPVGAKRPVIRPWSRPSVRIRSFTLTDMHLLSSKEITQRLQNELRGIVTRMETNRLELLRWEPRGAIRA
jgi:1-acyl-sn-glycerol-3-phosphate acyltransferase